MKLPTFDLPHRAAPSAALALIFASSLLGTTTAEAAQQSNSCEKAEADCQSMANSIARRSSKSGVKSITCTTTKTATVTLHNGNSVMVGWVGGLATGAVLDGFSGLPTRNCAFRYSCPRSGIKFDKIFCSDD